MSMNDTDKWASGVINELFEEERKYDENVGVIGYNENKEYEDSAIIPDKDLIANENSFCRGDKNGLRIKLMEKSDATSLSSDNSLNTNDGICEQSHTGYNTPESLPYNSQDNCIHSVNNKWDIIFNGKTLDYESEEILDKRSGMLSDPEEIRAARETLNKLLTFCENTVQEIYSENLITEKLQIYKNDATSSNTFTNDFVSEKSAIKENKTENEINKILCPTIGGYYEGRTINLERNGKNIIGFSSCDRQNNEPKESKRSPLIELPSKSFKENFLEEEMKFCYDECDSTVRRRNTDDSNEKPEDKIVNDLKNLDVKEGNFLLDDGSTLEVKDAVTKIFSEDGDTCDKLSPKDTNENNVNEAIQFKEKNRKSIEDYTEGFDSTYKKYKNRILKRDLFRNSTASSISRNYPVVDTDTDVIKIERKYINNANEHETFSSTHQKKKVPLDENYDDEVIFQRTVSVIRVYRNACETVENLFIRPCAILIAESADLLIFMLFLSICIFYMLHEKVKEKILKYSRGKNERGSDGMSMGEKDLAMDHGESRNLSANFQRSETDIGNEKYKAEKSVISFTPEEDVKNGNQVNDSSNVLIINSKDVLILDAGFENIKPKFGKLYEKVEYFEFCKEAKIVAVVRLHENSVVHIVLKAYEGSIKDNIEGYEFDSEIIASSLNSEFKLLNSIENDQCKISKFSQKFQKVSEYGEDEELRITSLINPNNANFKKLSNIFDRDEGLILNSTEVDFKHLSISEEDISGISFRTSEEQIVSRNSMNVNLPSFSSRSDIALQTSSSSSLNKIEKVPIKKWCSTPFRNGNISKELEVTRGDTTDLLINLRSSASEICEHKEKGKLQFSMIQKTEDFAANFPVKSFKLLPRNLNDTFRKGSKYFDDSSNSPTTTDSDRPTFDATTDNSFVCDNLEFLPKLSNANTSTEFESLVETEINSEVDKKVLKKKTSGGLRRRMSVILNNWKNMQVMHCATANSRKKYKKHSEAT